MRDEVWSEIESRFAFSGERSLRILGHSLGAALATLMALDIATNRHFSKTISIRTFGSPCVGNHAFVKNYNQHINDSKRYTIYMDPGGYSNFF